MRDALTRLAADGLLRAEGDRHRTTRRWQAAMARAALRLVQSGDTRDDLRVPIVAAVLELYGDEIADDEAAALVAAMYSIELVELRPILAAQPPPPRLDSRDRGR
jgi:hypothetical protein